MQVRSARLFDCAIFSVTSRVDICPPEVNILPSRPFVIRTCLHKSGEYINLFSYSKMGKRCIVQFCGNSNKTGHSTHMFPRDLNLRRQWIKFVQVKRADFVQPTKHSIICGAHFTSDCFEGAYMREMGFKKLTDLIPSAVPTIQPQTPQQKAFSEMRKRTMESEETEQTVGKSSKRSRKSRAVQKLEVNRVSKILNGNKIY